MVREALGALINGQGRRAIWSDGQLAAAVLSAAPSFAWNQVNWENLDCYFSAAGLDVVPAVTEPLPSIRYCHDVIRFHRQYLAENLNWAIASGRYAEIADGVYAADGASMGPYVATDTRGGPIVLDEGARIEAHSVVRGPVRVGRDARLLEFSSTKDAVAVGHTTKIGGEVVASIVEPYSNKQHHGYLGNSYVGSWVNLGAGTSNSDLKNTYGEVRMEQDGQVMGTGTQFMGCVIGDHVKSAINTSIFTGKIVGVCSMLYGFITTNVPGFVSYARTLGQVSEIPAEVAILAQQRAFQRRAVPHREQDVEMIRTVFEFTRPEREIALSELACGHPHYETC
jgi:glucose-1-phosphate thymidylyltransferase